MLDRLDTEESVEIVEALFWRSEKMLAPEDRAYEDVDEFVETDQCCWYAGRA
jgi:hypothetical protein